MIIFCIIKVTKGQISDGIISKIFGIRSIMWKVYEKVHNIVNFGGHTATL